MKSYQEQYVEILENLLNFPDKKIKSRIGDVSSRFGETIRVELQREFPLMELKKIKFSNVLHELLWFINRDTNIKYLVDNDCNIWNDDAYRYYLEKTNKYIKNYSLFKHPIFSKEEFIEKIKNGEYGYGEMDRIYGKQWREFNGKTDQLMNCINTLKTNPDDRRMIVTAHNPTDIENNVVGLPSCHNMFQFYTVPMTRDERLFYYHYSDKYVIVSENDDDEVLDIRDVPKYKLNIWFNLRSNDFFLGNPYNIASYALLCHIVGNFVNMIPNQLVCNIVDCHLYDEHKNAAVELLDRYSDDSTYCKSELLIKRNLESINDISFNDFKLINYNPQSYIKAKLLT